jgi:hypothetical protein
MARLLGLRRAWSVPGRLLDALPTGGLSNMDRPAGTSSAREEAVSGTPCALGPEGVDR